MMIVREGKIKISWQKPNPIRRKALLIFPKLIASPLHRPSGWHICVMSTSPALKDQVNSIAIDLLFIQPAPSLGGGAVRVFSSGKG